MNVTVVIGMIRIVSYGFPDMFVYGGQVGESVGRKIADGGSV